MKTAYDSEKLTESLKIDMALLGDFDLFAFSHKKPALNSRVYTEYAVDFGVEEVEADKDEEKDAMKASELMEILQRQNALIYL